MDSLGSRVNLLAASELTVAIVSREPEFARSLMARWRAERVVPGFVALAADPALVAPLASSGAEVASVGVGECDLILVGGVPAERLAPLLKQLDPATRPLICIVAEGEYRAVRESFPHLLLLPQDEYWMENTILFAGECLRRRHAVLRALRAEQLLAANQGHATLGKYVVEMRHNLNNALTSVLGNAELVLLNAESFSGEVRDQVETIRNTALRLHEIMQRFWSLEAEMKAVERNWPEEKISRAVGAVR